MAIKKKLIHFDSYSVFNSQKLSANSTNTSYTLGVDGEVTSGEPNILFGTICFIKDVKKIWTHAALYDCPTVDYSSWATTEALESGLSEKVDKVSGKGLSTEDFTTALKTKLNSLSNYDDTEINEAVESLQTQVNTLVSGNASTAIESFNEIIAFLEGITDSEDLESIIASIEQQIAAKQDKITDLDTIRAGAAKGATALQSYTEKYTGTVTGIKMNGASKGTSGVVDLGTVITAHQDISGKLDKTTAASTYATKTELNNKQDSVLKFENVAASAWVSDSTYSDYAYRCDMTCTGTTANYVAEVIFGIDEATGGDYAPICETSTDTVSIWSKVNTSITIPTILITT